MRDIKDIFIEVANNEGIKITNLEAKIGASKGVLSRAIAKNTDIQSKWLFKLVENYPQYNPEWLLNGIAPMLKEDSPVYGNPTQSVKEVNKTTKSQFLTQADFLQRHQLVPLYDIEASAGLVALFQSDRTTPIDYISMPNLPKVDGALYVTGDSMYPLLKSGDIVFYKKINNILDNLFFGEMYLLDIQNDGDDYTTVKYVHTSDRGSDWIKLVSQNQYHQPKDVHLSTVKAAAFVKASFRRNSMA